MLDAQNTWRIHKIQACIYCKYRPISQEKHPYLWNIFYKRFIEFVNSVTVELRCSSDELDQVGHSLISYITPCLEEMYVVYI